MMYLPHYGPRRARDPARKRTLLEGPSEEVLPRLRQAVLDARRAGDWLAARPDVDSSRVGLVGISLGAILGSLAAGVDDRFSRGVFILGGGDIPAILFHGSREVAKSKRTLEEEGWTLEKLRERWKSVEPCTFASRLRPDDVLMINAEEDEVVPRACTEKLHDAIGRPEIRWIRGGHYGIVLHLVPVLRDLTAHLLKPPAPRPDPSAGPPRIRTLLLESVQQAPMEIRGPFVLKTPGISAAERLERLAPTTVRIEDGKIDLGSRASPAPRVVLAPEPDVAVALEGRVYDGAIEIVRAGDDSFHVINETDLESYVAGVVGPEIGPDAPLEALKAQAIASRTFAWTALGRDALFDVHADTRSQVYRGRPAAGGAPGRAAKETCGMMLTWNGRPFRAWFSSTCGGFTESAAEAFGATEIPPLAGVKCGSCGGSRRAEWSVVIPEADFKAGPFVRLSASSLTPSGRVREAVFTREDGTAKGVAARELRATLGYDRLPSTRFEAVKEGDKVRLTGKGWGHGCGLCQEGALGMARQGRTCEEILKKYYPGAEVRKSWGE
jgi:stage II sporulation protein D